MSQTVWDITSWDISQDIDGNMWFALGGVSKFDGQSFTVLLLSRPGCDFP
jgi:hypothetical protein